nr:hypothetical protein [Tanacetum cinerariifolium]
DDDNDEEEELAKDDEEDKETDKGGDEVRESEGEAPIPPPIIPSIILENLPTFNSAFRFEERLRSLETSFSEYRQTN